MRAAHARLDVYAHHPYPGSPHETPVSGGCGECAAITMANLPILLRAVAKAFPGRHVWLTEYGYQTNPPDPLFGVSPSRQALLIGEAALRAYELPRVDMLIHFLYRDEPAIGAWQSGLVARDGRPKPALDAFARPLAQVSRRVLWGQVRPGSGRRDYRLQRLVGGHARWLGAMRRTDLRGFFRRSVPLRRDERVRIWTPNGVGAWITVA
jgi:hypothetical protein